MKFATYYIALVSLMGAMTMSGCANNDIDDNDTQNTMGTTTFGVTLPNNTDSRVALTDQDPNGLKFAWSKGDQIGILVANTNNLGGVISGTNADYRVDYVEGTEAATVTQTSDIGIFKAHLSKGENTASGTFSLNGYNLEYPTFTNKLFYGFYPSTLTVKNLDLQNQGQGAWRDMSYAVDYSATQDGTIDYVASHAVMVGSAKGAESFDSQKMSLQNATSILRLKLTFPIQVSSLSFHFIAKDASGNDQLVTKETMYIRSDGGTTAPSDITKGSYSVFYSGSHSQYVYTVYLAVLPQTCTVAPKITCSASVEGGSGGPFVYQMKSIPTFVAGKVHTINATMTSGT